MGYGIRDTRHGIRDAGYGIRGTGYGIRGTGYGIRGTGYGIRDAGHGISLGHFEWEIPSRARAALCADFWSYIRVAQGENRKKKSVKSLSLRTECAALRKKIKFQKK